MGEAVSSNLYFQQHWCIYDNSRNVLRRNLPLEGRYIMLFHYPSLMIKVFCDKVGDYADF